MAVIDVDSFHFSKEIFIYNTVKNEIKKFKKVQKCDDGYLFIMEGQ